MEWALRARWEIALDRVLTLFLTKGVKATLTSKGQITLPVSLRRKLGLQAGDVLEFDENAPYIKAHKAFNPEDMRAVIGRGKGRRGERDSRAWVEYLRGPVELP